MIINESLINSDAIIFNKKDIELYEKSLDKLNNDDAPIFKKKDENFLLEFASFFVVQNDYKYRSQKVIIILL